jgi:hypothetical protein
MMQQVNRCNNQARVCTPRLALGNKHTMYKSVRLYEIRSLLVARFQIVVLRVDATCRVVDWQL